MRTAVRRLLSAMLLLWSAGALAEERDMSVLVLDQICHDADLRSQSACSGFLIGLLAGLQMSTKMSRKGKPVCVPGSVTPDKLILMLDKIVNEKPEFAGLPGLEAIAVGLQVEFPCRPQPLPTAVPPVPPKR
jgi:hypothetical protein